MSKLIDALMENGDLRQRLGNDLLVSYEILRTLHYRSRGKASDRDVSVDGKSHDRTRTVAKNLINCCDSVASFDSILKAVSRMKKIGLILESPEGYLTVNENTLHDNRFTAKGKAKKKEKGKEEATIAWKELNTGPLSFSSVGQSTHTDVLPTEGREVLKRVKASELKTWETMSDTKLNPENDSDLVKALMAEARRAR